MRGASGNFLGGQCVVWEGFARVASWWFVKKGDGGGQLKSISHHRLAHFPVLFTTISVCSYWICIFGTDCAYLLLCMVHTQTHTYILRYLTLLTCHARAALYLAACLQRYVTRDVFYSALLILKPCRACPNIRLSTCIPSTVSS